MVENKEDAKTQGYKNYTINKNVENNTVNYDKRIIQILQRFRNVRNDKNN